jgi:RNA polymerase sigma-70 factor (ECF subfamily)
MSEEVRSRHALVNQLLTALRAGDVQGMVAVLDPDFVLHLDETVAQPGGPREVRGAEIWARQAVIFARQAPSMEAVLVDGVPGALMAPNGRLMRVLRFTFAGEKISEIEVIGDRKRLEGFELATTG